MLNRQNTKFNFVGLKFKIKKTKFSETLKILQSEMCPSPSINIHPDWVAVEVIVEENIERNLIPSLYRFNAFDIYSYSLKEIA